MSVIASPLELRSQSSLIVVLAWVVTLFTVVPTIILRQFFDRDASWLFWAQVVLLLGLVAVSFGWKTVQPLRGYCLILAIVLLSERLVFSSLVLHSDIWTDVFNPQAGALLPYAGLRLGLADPFPVRCRGLYACVRHSPLGVLHQT
jgi:hypothetical protein